ncbi:hypothetical protein EIP91_009452 [Steccherinum ochraceum]|uniref:Uncharacterized protein n=1 Tax=Steccherinum ochraceum TaxID=92696 RepID=A0A4R0RP22_9APHY|nr:hypothetical protein EIP91_009452 [Steccherinum ochraceum]
MLHSPAASNASLPGGFWGRFKPTPKPKDAELRQPSAAVAVPRLLTLAFEEMETVRKLPSSFNELEIVVREWLRPPPDAVFALRVPKEYVSIATARLVSGTHIYLTGEDSYQIAILGAQGLRVEIVGDAPPPAEDEPPPPPPPPVLEMPATFNLELSPGQQVALDTIISSDELDMARMEDGTTVDGMFWGKLQIVHDGDEHNMEFSGTRIINSDEVPPDLLIDSRLISKLALITAKPVAAKCHLNIYSPIQQYCDLVLTLSPYWKLGLAHPAPEPVQENKVKFFLRVHPGGAIEHFESATHATSLYYEAIPDPGLIDPLDFITPRNGFAMSYRDFVTHLGNVLDQVGMTLYARTNFINNNLSAFAQHKNIAYRLMSPSKIAAAIDISVTVENCVFTRLFLMFRGVSNDEMQNFSDAGEKEANAMNWRETIGWSELSKDKSQFRVLETSILELA